MSGTNLSIHNITCPTDFSEFAASAFAESVRLARWFGAKVTVVHVLPMAASLAADMSYLSLPAEPDDAEKEAAREQLQRFVDATEHAGVPIGLECPQGDACEEIRKTAQKTGADLVVMGTHGRSGFKRLVLGSVTEALLNRAPAPVLTVNRALPHRTGLYRTVLCATDLSEGSAGTVAVALEIAGEGAQRLTILSVIEHHVEAAGGALERAVLAEMHRLLPYQVRGAYRIDERVAFGETDREILGVAAEEGADLIVMGHHGGGVLGHVFESTVRRVVRDAACPVIVVPAGHVWRATGLVREELVALAQGDGSPGLALTWDL